MNKDNGMLWSCMCSLIEILWVLEEKISLNCWQVQHDAPVTEIFEFNLHVNFLYFLWNRVNLFGIFSTYEKLRAFERNVKLENSCLMSWRREDTPPMVLTSGGQRRITVGKRAVCILLECFLVTARRHITFPQLHWERQGDGVCLRWEVGGGYRFLVAATEVRSTHPVWMNSCCHCYKLFRIRNYLKILFALHW